jgi:hypothetical protein
MKTGIAALLGAAALTTLAAAAEVPDLNDVDVGQIAQAVAGYAPGEIIRFGSPGKCGLEESARCTRTVAVLVKREATHKTVFLEQVDGNWIVSPAFIAGVKAEEDMRRQFEADLKRLRSAK